MVYQVEKRNWPLYQENYEMMSLKKDTEPQASLGWTLMDDVDEKELDYYAEEEEEN